MEDGFCGFLKRSCFFNESVCFFGFRHFGRRFCGLFSYEFISFFETELFFNQSVVFFWLQAFWKMGSVVFLKRSCFFNESVVFLASGILEDGSVAFFFI